MATTEKQSKQEAQTAKDMERTAAVLADGPLHIHAICSKLRIPRKSARARRLYLAVKGDTARFKRSEVAPSVWELVA